ncbi:Aspartate/tyrosine/aromatic aminotransferase [Thermoplasmatales archaeon BRNA1]|nr:Aspartate/tyrosine/aromatic aminotransferase [Thermoplasmatales archaeon BRNA1]
MAARFKQADRLQKLPPYLFVRLEKLAAEQRAKGVDMIDFGIGDPDLPCPGEIVRAMKKAADVNENQKYSSSQGEKDLRQAIAEYYRKKYNVKLNPDTEICVTIGSKEGIFNIAQAFVNDGEKIIAPSPGYPVYSGAAPIFNNAVCEKVALRKEKNWLLDVKDCPTDARLMYLCYPNNPTGATCDVDYIKNVYKWAKRNKTIMAFDNAYNELTFDGYRAPSALQAGKDCIEFCSFSKTFDMTGFRIGWAAGNEELIAGLTKCKGQIDSGAPIFIQKAAKFGLEMYNDDGTLPAAAQRNVDEFGERRKMLVEGLRDLGYECDMPKGTFYVWFDCGKDSGEFTQEMIRKGVIVTPGDGFGEAGAGYIRMAVTRSKDRIAEALRRMGKKND